MTELLKPLQKRYWVFHSTEYEECSSLEDFVKSFNTKKAAFELASKAKELGRVFDSHTAKSWRFNNRSNAYHDTPASPSEQPINEALL